MFAIQKKYVDQLRDEITDRKFLEFCAERLGHSTEEIEGSVATCWGEMLFGLDLLEGIDLWRKRILEIGCGMGLTSLILHRHGLDVMSIEPGSGGFDLNAQIGLCIRERLEINDMRILDLEAEALRPDQHGRFDLAFSVNVLEHIRDLEGAIAAMCRVLMPGGLMRHTCPNYTVPYEPHFGILLVPFVPAVTSWFMPKVRRTELWASLNFVTLRRIERAFRSNGLACRFDRGTMYRAFTRLEHDQSFRARQGGNLVVGLAHVILRRSGLLRLLSALPPRLATPMTFEVRHSAPTAGVPAA